MSILTLNTNAIFKTASSKFIQSQMTDELQEKINDSTITCLSDTHLTEEDKVKMEKIFNNHQVIATTSGRKRAGVAIIVDKQRFEDEPIKVTMEENFANSHNRATDGPRYVIATLKRTDICKNLGPGAIKR